MKRYEELIALIDSLEADFEKFYNNNNLAAGTRLRKAMSEIKNLAQEIRLEVQNIKNSDGGTGFG